MISISTLCLSSLMFQHPSTVEYQNSKQHIMPRFPKPQKLAVPVKPPKGHFFFAGHTIARVKWWTSGPMRKLYFLLVVMIMVLQLPLWPPTPPKHPQTSPEHRTDVIIYQHGQRLRWKHDEWSAGPDILARILQSSKRVDFETFQRLYESWLPYWTLLCALHH